MRKDDIKIKMVIVRWVETMQRRVRLRAEPISNSVLAEGSYSFRLSAAAISLVNLSTKAALLEPQ